MLSWKVLQYPEIFLEYALSLAVKKNIRQKSLLKSAELLITHSMEGFKIELFPIDNRIFDKDSDIHTRGRRLAGCHIHH